LGAAIAELGKKILLVDANFSSPNLGLHLNVINPETTLHHVLSREANVSDAICKLESFDLLPSSIFHQMNINPLKLKDKINTQKESLQNENIYSNAVVISHNKCTNRYCLHKKW